MRPSYHSVSDLLLEYSSLTGIGEDSERLRTARKEIDPLQSKTDNPVKKAARATAKARSSRDSDDIAGAVSRTQVAGVYAKSHGYPNLTKQLSRHKETLRKYAAATRKMKALQSKAGRKRHVQDLRAKLKVTALHRKLKLRKTHS